MGIILPPLFLLLQKLVIRQHIGKISVIGRNTQGVRLLRLDEKDRIGDVAKIVLGNDENGIDDSESE